MKRMHLLMSVMHQQWSKPNPAVPRVFPPYFRDGVLALVDWDKPEIVWAKPFDSAAGICFYSDDRLIVASMVGQRLLCFDRDFNLQFVYRDPLFNDLHTVTRTPDGILAAASGTDSLMELDAYGRVLWRWLATEHGLDRRVGGARRRVDRRLDYGNLPPQTSTQTTHINSARVHGDTVLATLFAQGALIQIDRATGQFTRLVDGMLRPHAVRPRSDGGWSVCDSGSNAVVTMTPDFGIRDIVEVDLDWPQDAMEMPGAKTMLVMDANNMRLVEIDMANHQVIKELRYPSTWKGFTIEVVPEPWVSALLQAGSQEYDFRTTREEGRNGHAPELVASAVEG
jgi:hypothetical protein